MEHSEPQSTFKEALGAVILFLLVLAGFFGVYRFHHLLFTLFVAIIFGTMARPIHQWLINRRVPKYLVSTLMLVGLLALVIGFVLLLLPVLSSQYQTLFSAIPRYYSIIRDWIASRKNELVVRLSESLPVQLSLGEQLPSPSPDAITTLNSAVRFLGSGLNNVFFGFVLLLLSYYWMVSGPQIVASSLFFVKQDKRQNVLEIAQEIELKLTRYLVGQGVLSLSIAGLSLVVFLVLRLPNAFLLALIAGLFEAVPMVGPILGAIPAVLVALSMSPTTVIWVIISTLIIQQIENNLLVPRIMNKVVGVNPFISILSISTFTSLYGIGGALMAIPLAAVIQLILDRTLMRKEPETEVLIGGRDKLNVLRYDTQEFLSGIRNQARQTQPGDTQNRTRIDSVMEEMEMVARDLDTLLAQKAEGKNA
ncbi:MAG: AI-2E family transporter [Chloroflexi bacterium]|nr:AI-2E family transporter [Chloroflexota bacterium]